MSRTNNLRIITGLLITVLFFGCGGSEKKATSTGLQDGRIEVENDSHLTSGSARVAVTVTYLAESGEIVTKIGVGEKKLVTGDAILKGGTEVTLTFKPDMNCHVIIDKKVVVDGDTIVRVKYIGPCGSGVLNVE